MSAVIAPTEIQKVTIEIDGQAIQVPKGAMIIHAADQAGIAIPRFCYHDKLPIAANCRMCLVDVEKSPKPMPACATPVMDGMKVFTQSKRALDSQRNVMEFLLINHPLDCPICDQGGECELQDLALGYGRSVSRFTERKRVVADEDLGSLVATDMTRCIHCTRCVRFTSEIAGTYEMGGMYRGEHTEIGTYIGKALTSELSGNIIDVCPVGALTNKVFRFRARAWELIAKESIGYHDALGSHLYLHTRRGEVLRCVPRSNEAINECWLADRDRYSHTALLADDRVQQPMIRDETGVLRVVTWEEAIAYTAVGLKRALAEHSAEQIAALVAPMTSNEEGFLLAQLMRALGSDHIDHRLRTLDFTDQVAGAIFEMPLAAVEQAQCIFIVGSNPRLDQPLLGHRVRKAWKNGSQIFAVNPIAFDFHFDVVEQCIASPWQMVEALAAIAKAVAEITKKPMDANLAVFTQDVVASETHRVIAQALQAANSGVLLFGDFAVQHPMASVLRALSRYIAAATQTAFNEVAAGANAVGLTHMGVIPLNNGQHAYDILQNTPQVLLTYNVFPLDCAQPTLLEQAQEKAGFVVAFSAYADNCIKNTAHVILPIGLLPEIDATLVNVDGVAQTITAGAKLPGEARPGWRVLRALGAALGLPGFEFTELVELRAAMSSISVPIKTVTTQLSKMPDYGTSEDNTSALVRINTVAIYGVDAVVRRAAALQATPLAKPAQAVIHPADAERLALVAGEQITVADGQNEANLYLQVHTQVPYGAIWIESGLPETKILQPTGAMLQVKRA